MRHSRYFLCCMKADIRVIRVNVNVAKWHPKIPLPHPYTRWNGFGLKHFAWHNWSMIEYLRDWT